MPSPTQISFLLLLFLSSSCRFSVPISVTFQHVIYSQTIHFWESTLQIIFILSARAYTNCSPNSSERLISEKRYGWENTPHAMEFKRTQRQTRIRSNIHFILPSEHFRKRCTYDLHSLYHFILVAFFQVNNKQAIPWFRWD